MKTLFLISLIIFSACSDKVEEKTVSETIQEKVDLKKQLVVGPESLVPLSQPIALIFNDVLVPYHLIGVELAENPFSFEPKISGQAKWELGNKLTFTPNTVLPAGQKYNLKIDGKKAIGNNRDVNNLNFSFKVMEQEVLSAKGDFIPVAGKKNTVKLQIEFVFAGKVLQEEFKKDLKLKDDKSLTFSLQKGSKPNHFLIKSTELKRKNNGRSITAYLPAKYSVRGDQKWEKPFVLASKTNFIVLSDMDLSNSNEKMATYAFRFSDPIATHIDLSGFVTVEGLKVFKLQVEGKYLKVKGNMLAGKQYAIKIVKGFPSALGTKLSKSYNKSFSINNLKPELKWLSQGVYLPSANNSKLQFKSINVKKVSIVISEVHQNNTSFFLQKNKLKDKSHNPGGSGYFRSNYKDLSRVGKEIVRLDKELGASANKWHKTEIDLSALLKTKKKALFIVNLQYDYKDLLGRCQNNQDKLESSDLYFEDEGYYKNPCKNHYYYWRGNLNKMVVQSDVGLTVKESGGFYHVFAANLVTSNPISGLKLTNLSYANQELETLFTNTNGFAKFKKQGHALYGEHPSGLALLKWNKQDWEKNKFDVGGVNAGVGGTNVFFYTERGVHRPGDTIHLSAIVRMDRKVPPSDLPMAWEVKNPNNQIVLEHSIKKNKNGHLYLAIPTRVKSPTGTWFVRLKIGDKKYSKSLPVEMVKPNRLKVKLNMDKEAKRKLIGKVEAKYLFGTPIKETKVEVRASFNSKNLKLQKYPKYNFNHPENEFSSRNIMLSYGVTDSKGNFKFDKKIENVEKAPALVRANLEAKVYEKGGSFTLAKKSKILSPYSSYVGVINPTKWGSVQMNQKFDIETIVVNDKGDLKKNIPLEVNVYVNRSHWWWHYDDDDRKEFTKKEATYKVLSKNIQSANGKLKFSIKVEDYGRHLVEVVNKKSGHKTGMFFYASDWNSGVASKSKERNFLKINLDRGIYAPGDSVTLSFDSPAKGTAYITLEQGEEVLKQEWKKVTPGQTKFSFLATKAMLPNIYASVSLIQPLQENTNDVPMRIYGIKPIFIEDPNSRLQVDWNVPKQIQPKETFKVSIQSNSKQEGTYTLAMVDEGLLDLTNFKTPNPWKYYFKKVRLGVKTKDNYDEVLGSLYPDMDRYFSIGGDEMDEEADSRAGNSKARRFIPAIYFSKPFVLAAGKKKNIEITMPNYIGSVRFMLVGATGDQYMSAEKTTPVSQPLMILPTIPRIARPGDEFSLPVSIFALEDNIGEVEVSLTNVGELKIKGSKSQTIKFDRKDEKDISFALQASDKVGQDSIHIIAKSKSFEADYKVALPLQSAAAYQTATIDTMVKNTTYEMTLEKLGLDGTNKAYLQISKMPSLQLQERIKSLIRYPYGCLEQTVSSVFPQLYLPKLLDLSEGQKQRIDDAIHASFERLKTFQLSRGGFAYWPRGFYSSRYSDWATSYVGHFLVEAKSLGYKVPDSLWDTWVEDANDRAKVVNTKNHKYQNYRLFVLALAEIPNIGAMNLLKENHLKTLDALSKKLLATSYQLAGQTKVAQEIDLFIVTEESPYRELAGTYGSNFRDQALMSYLSTIIDTPVEVSKKMTKLVNTFRGQNWYSTQESAMALLAFGKYFPNQEQSGDVDYKLSIGGKSQTQTLSTQMQEIPLIEQWGEKISISAEKTLFISIVREGIPKVDSLKTQSKNLLLSRNFYSEDGYPLTTFTLPQGKEVWVVYTVKIENKERLKNVALSSLFPAGWEIFNPRLENRTLPEWLKRQGLSSPTYMDIRDDRVNWFFDIGYKGYAKFAIRINPTFKGNYTLPAVIAETMYSPDYFSAIAGSRAVVE